MFKIIVYLAFLSVVGFNLFSYGMSLTSLFYISLQSSLLWVISCWLEPVLSKTSPFDRGFPLLALLIVLGLISSLILWGFTTSFSGNVLFLLLVIGLFLLILFITFVGYSANLFSG